MLQRPVWSIWSCPKNYLSVWLSQGNFGGHEVFLVASSFHHKSLSYPHGTARKFEDMKQPCCHRKLYGTFCLYTESFRRPFFNNNHNILISKCETQPPKIVVNLLENLRIFQTNGTVIQKFLAFLKLWKFLGNICSFEQLFYRIAGKNEIQLSTFLGLFGRRNKKYNLQYRLYSLGIQNNVIICLSDHQT